jgi:CheY-like chemotaxis protein
MISREQSNSVRILLAEDDPTNQYVFNTILTSAGYELEIHPNGRDALEAARRQPPDLILLDMMMPVMDGYETAFHLATEPLFDDIPVIALTARAMKGDREKTIESGCDGYLAKPVSRKNLIAAVEFWLARPSAEWMDERVAKRQRFGRSA